MRSWILLLPGLVACNVEHLTTGEALVALQETNLSSRGEAATTEPIEVSTEFTIGAALEAAAAELADFWASQAECTEVTVEGTTLTIDYGTTEDDCVWSGHTYAGQAVVTVDSTEPGELRVHHDWIGLSNGDVRVDGGADVTWASADGTRRVVTDHTWTDEADGSAMDVSGDHVMGWIDEDAGVLGGITLAGTRDWVSDSGEWSLDMTEVEVRLQDPCPQAGAFTVTNPDGKQLEISYTRVDDDTIEATLSGTRQPLVFHVHALGSIEQVE